jgi:hypothetical protein
MGHGGMAYLGLSGAALQRETQMEPNKREYQDVQ